MDLLPNETIIFQWFLFITALISLHYGVFRPVLRLIEARRERTDGEREKTEKLLIRGSDLGKEYQLRIDEAQAAGVRERASRLREAEAVQRKTVGEARSAIDKQLDRLRLNLEKEARSTAVELKQFSQSIAKEMAEKVLGRAL